MMKQRPSASGLKPSKACKLIMMMLGVKLCMFSWVFFEHLTGERQIYGGAVAEAATENQTPPAASPAIPPSAPQTPAQVPQTGAPAAQSPAPGTGKPEAQPLDSGLSREALNRKQEELNRREQNLKAMEDEINAKLEQMQILEARLQDMLKEADAAKDAKFRQLVDVISNMKAKQAAEVLSTLDERIAVRVLAGMRGRQAGEILTYAQPEKAARLSEALARMNMGID